MSYFLKNLKTLIFFGVLFIFYFIFFISVNAQQDTPQFMVSWKTNSFTPSWYQGKIFPTTGSRIDIKFDLIDSGKIVDLSKSTVRWYINDNLVINETNGLGIKSYFFITNDYVGNNINVRISIPNYNGNVLDSVIDIPIANPEVVINIPYPDKLVPTGKLNLEAISFFFNISDNSKLLFLWNANGQLSPATGNPFLNLNIEAAAGPEIDLGILIKNIANELETASKNIKLKTR